MTIPFGYQPWLVMPGGTSGLDLARKVRAFDRSVRILLASGYKDTALFARGALGPEDHVLSKPYRKSEPAKKLRWMRDGADRAAGDGDDSARIST